MSSDDIKQVLVFGATGGIGKALCTLLLSSGKTVYGFYFSNHGLAQKMSRQNGIRLRQIDLAVISTIDALCLPPADAVYYAAGLPYFSSHFFDFDSTALQQLINIDVLALVAVLRVLLTRRQTAPRKLILVSSVVAKRPKTIYHLSKALQAHALECMLPLLTDKGVSVSIIRAPWVDTIMYAKYLEFTRNHGSFRSVATSPISPSVVAAACLRETTNNAPFATVNL